MLARVRSIIRRNGWVEYQRPYELNILGVRGAETRANSFDDEIHVYHRSPDGKKWSYHGFKATTDPGTFWLSNPAMGGTAILAAGQYRGAYGKARHRGKYHALCQVNGPVTVFRDYNRDSVLDFFNGTAQTGYFGINVHRARQTGQTKTIDAFSAGCQVFADAGDFVGFMGMCERHRALYGNRFTYSLVDYRAIRRETRRRAAYGLAAAGLAAGGYLSYNKLGWQKGK